MYINSPGGSVSAGFGIYDTMQIIKPQVNTICTGFAASYGAILLLAGAKGKRLALPNSEIMIHQPLGGVQGRATDIAITAKRILKTREKLAHIISERTGQSVERVERIWSGIILCRRKKRRNTGLLTISSPNCDAIR